ncbi:MAG TPA: ABC transporter permease, partial [Verrucomicrobiae bacterium]|nr:ABC transporter permease [Verrucomicrobiae bacterium]
MRSLVEDLRFAVRMLRRSPGFSLIAVVTLALGIGANTAIFTVADSLLLRPMPFHDPDRLVLVWGDRPREGFDVLPFSWENFTEFREQATSFESLGAFFSYPGNTFNLTASGEPERIQAAYLSAEVLPALGVAPSLGRAFTSDEDRPGAGGVVLISQGLWRRRFGAAGDIVGRTLILDGQPRTITGVMPESFTFPRYPADADVWLPLATEPNSARRFSRGTRYLSVIGRLKPGTTVAGAQAEATAVAGRLAAKYPRYNEGLGAKVTPLRAQAAGSMRPAILVLGAAVGFVLLIACANLASLLLARAKSREREVALRVALGASRARLMRQWMTESALLAAVGGAAGLLVAVWGLDFLSFIPYNVPSFATPYVVAPGQIAMRPEVFAFSLGLSLATGLLLGLVPALQATRGDFAASLKGGS